MSDYCRCPHCRGINYIDDRYCADCFRAMWTVPKQTQENSTA